MPSESRIAAVRGATGVASNTPAAIHEATARLLRELIALNRITPEAIVSAIFTSTPDLDADFPARVARLLGWHDVPLLGAQEVGVAGAPQRIVRVLLTLRDVAADVTLTPVYLGEAAALRPDLARGGAGGGDVRTLGDAPATGAPEPPARAVAILGLGQIGGSIGLALGRSGGWRRTGWDAEPGVTRRAIEAGAIDVVADSLEQACAVADIAVAAVPVDALPGVITAAAAALPRGATLLDTGSARAGVTEALARAAERGVRAIGGHPLAGVAGRGFDAAGAGLFDGTRFALLPVAGEPPEPALALVHDLGATPVMVEPDRHDAALARTSHLPYLVARSLDTVGAAAAREGLSGPAFRDMTRVAASDPRMALAFCRANAREVRAAWGELRERVDRDVAALDEPQR